MNKLNELMSYKIKILQFSIPKNHKGKETVIQYTPAYPCKSHGNTNTTNIQIDTPGFKRKFKSTNDRSTYKAIAEKHHPKLETTLHVSNMMKRIPDTKYRENNKLMIFIGRNQRSSRDMNH